MKVRIEYGLTVIHLVDVVGDAESFMRHINKARAADAMITYEGAGAEKDGMVQQRGIVAIPANAITKVVME
jgi:hypothetical protein